MSFIWWSRRAAWRCDGSSRLIDDRPELTRRLRFTTAERLTGFVFRHGAGAIVPHALPAGLRRLRPVLSAAPPRWRANIAPVAIVCLAALAGLIIAPAQIRARLGNLARGMSFSPGSALRLAGAFIAWTTADPPLDLRDDELPVYTIISALYREATSVDGLLTAIERLDYPPEKLDVKLVIEADDTETRAAIAASKSRIPHRGHHRAGRRARAPSRRRSTSRCRSRAAASR